MISKETILELQKIFKNEYGRDVSFEEATEMAHNLIGFFGVLYKIDERIKNKSKKYSNVNEESLL